VAIELRIPGLVLTEHEFAVPLDHGAPDGERILDRLLAPARRCA
jgi:hypothetical protein